MYLRKGGWHSGAILGHPSAGSKAPIWGPNQGRRKYWVLYDMVISGLFIENKIIRICRFIRHIANKQKTS